MAPPPHDSPRLKEVFTSARALPASGRQAYLSTACAGNEALGASSATVEREWAMAKAWLYQRLSTSDRTRP